MAYVNQQCCSIGQGPCRHAIRHDVEVIQQLAPKTLCRWGKNVRSYWLKTLGFCGFTVLPQTDVKEKTKRTSEDSVIRMCDDSVITQLG